MLDDCATSGLAVPKSHWARRIEEPPFYGYPLRPGITFTYLGVRVNNEARVLMKDGTPTANMFAAGEIMAGNVLGQGLSRRHRHDHRHGIRPHRRGGSGGACQQLKPCTKPTG